MLYVIWKLFSVCKRLGFNENMPFVQPTKQTVAWTVSGSSMVKCIFCQEKEYVHILWSYPPLFINTKNFIYSQHRFQIGWSVTVDYIHEWLTAHAQLWNTTSPWAKSSILFLMDLNCLAFINIVFIYFNIQISWICMFSQYKCTEIQLHNCIKISWPCNLIYFSFFSYQYEFNFMFGKRKKRDGTWDLLH